MSALDVDALDFALDLREYVAEWSRLCSDCDATWAEVTTTMRDVEGRPSSDAALRDLVTAHRKACDARDAVAVRDVAPAAARLVRHLDALGLLTEGEQ